jgi:hypothetical protein
MTYTIRFLDHDGRPARERRIECETDEALEVVAAERHRHGMEIWQGERLLWSFAPSLSRA